MVRRVRAAAAASLCALALLASLHAGSALAQSTLPNPEAGTGEVPAEAPSEAPAEEPGRTQGVRFEYGAAPERQVQLSGAPGNGLRIEIDDRYSLNIRSRFVTRHLMRRPAVEDGETAEPWRQNTDIATARLWFFGHVFRPQLTWMLQLALAEADFRGDVKSPVYDAFLNLELHREFNIRLGQYFVPFDRLRTIREWALQFGERPRPVQELTLDRDVGIMAYSNRAGGPNSILAWRLGAFGGGGIHRVQLREPGALLVARVVLRPLGQLDDDVDGDLERRRNPGLAIGAGLARNWNTDRLRSTTGVRWTEGSTSYRHFALDGIFKWRGLAVELAFYDRTADHDRVGDSFSRSGQGWVTQASWLVPRIPLELCGRVSRLYAREGTDPAYITEVDGRGLELAQGINWYFNGHRMKLQTDWFLRTAPSDPSVRRGEHLLLTQLDVTF